MFFRPEFGWRLLLPVVGAVGMALSSAAADRSPVLRVGLMSDTHVNCDLRSCERTRLALETFRREHVDVVAHLGDLANFHWPEAFRNYRRTLDAVYPDRNTGPRFLYAWGNHDSIDYSRRQQKDRQMDRSAAFAVMKEIIGIDHELAFETEIGGYAFLGFPETVTDVCSWKEFERRVAAACARHPGKPVFVLHHPPPRNTCDRSEKGCCATSRTIFNRHPQVVALSGHLHTTVLNERSIWQGEFTEVQTSCLYNWLAEAEGSKPQARSGWGVTVMDVYDDRLEFRRFDVRDPAERCRERRWTVPLPFVPSQASYALARRKANEPVGVFAADAAVTVVADGKPGTATIRFSTVVNPEVVRTYRVEVERRNGDVWEPLCRADAFGDFDELPCNRRGFLESRIEVARLGQAGTCRITVTPEGFFGALGKPLVRELAARRKD